IVEDSEPDAELLLFELKRGGFAPECRRVENAAQMKEALAAQWWDLVISDYRLPEFDGTAALQLLRDDGLDIPMIIVSGAIGEELAVSLMKAGVNDYMMKGNLHRLVPAI